MWKKLPKESGKEVMVIIDNNLTWIVRKHQGRMFTIKYLRTTIIMIVGHD